MKKKSDSKKDCEDKVANIPVCRECGIELTSENWYDSDKKGHYICKKCKYKCVKKWQRNNIDKYNQLVRESNHRLRNEVFDAYGGKCACCGETRKEYLTIDHVNGGGNKHRREMGFSTSTELYRWLRQNNYPDGFQVLCFNCNMGKGACSVCPQSKEFQMLFEEKLKESRYARYNWNLRLNIIEGYGGRCELCGEDNPHFLTIDHINGGGSKDIKMLGSWYKLYKKLQDENYPGDNYRLLCSNCNCALGFNRITEEEILQQNKH